MPVCFNAHSNRHVYGLFLKANLDRRNCFEGLVGDGAPLLAGCTEDHTRKGRQHIAQCTKYKERKERRKERLKMKAAYAGVCLLMSDARTSGSTAGSFTSTFNHTCSPPVQPSSLASLSQSPL
eukprot:1158599-Pelagomonas_calceolata.AAC.21